MQERPMLMWIRLKSSSTLLRSRNSVVRTGRRFIFVQGYRKSPSVLYRHGTHDWKESPGRNYPNKQRNPCRIYLIEWLGRKGCKIGKDTPRQVNIYFVRSGDVPVLHLILIWIHRIRLLLRVVNHICYINIRRQPHLGRVYGGRYSSYIWFYALVRDTREGYQFIQDDSYGTVDAFSTADEAFSAAEESEDPNDIVVAKVQIIKRK